MRQVRVVLRQLLIGAAITVIVAWACALWSPAAPEMWSGTAGARSGSARSVQREWVIAIGPRLFHEKEWPAIPDSVLCVDGIGISRLYMSGSTAILDSTPRFYQAALQCGWPWRALSAEGAGLVESATFPIFSVWDGGNTLDDVVRTGIAVPSWLTAREDVFGRSLPRTLRWPGFIADSAFWGCLAWLVHPGIRQFVRHRRYRGNRCVYCNHPMLNRDGVCSECGRSYAEGARRRVPA